MSNKIDIALPTPAPNSTVYSDTFTYKGTAMLELALGKVNESNGKALVVTIDWGDGSAREVYKRRIVNDYKTSSILPEILEGRFGGSVLGSYDHTYAPATTHVKNLSAQVLITFENGTYTKIVQPISLVHESYYDDIKEFQINSVGIHDNSLFSIVNLQSKYTKQTWPAVWVDTALKETSVLPNNVDCYRVGGGYIVGNDYDISCPPTTFDPLGFNS
jgi:hypothetical protein